MRATYVTACIIAALVVIWLTTGQLREEPEAPAMNIAEQNRRAAAMKEEQPLTRVRVATIHASDQSRILTIRGRTQNKRSVVVQAQINGIVTERPVERGDRVAEGDPLCRISVEDRAAVLEEARTGARQARIEHEGAVKLARQGLQSETVIAQARARLAAAEARLKRSELDMARLEITAPFAGVVENVQMETGQYVTPGTPCVTLVDLNPMLLIGAVSEIERPYLQPGLTATTALPNGHRIEGTVTFVASTADEGTRTYPIEIYVDNPDFSIPSGITTQIKIPVQTLLAQKISPALLTLDDEGRMGVRTVNGDNIVQFAEVQIVNDETDGIWVTGLPDTARIITVGQQLVVAGEEVEPTHESLGLAGDPPQPAEASL